MFSKLQFVIIIMIIKKKVTKKIDVQLNILTFK